MTLSIAQALYERHKVLTYPRTDSRALPEDYIGTVHETLNADEAAVGQEVEHPYAAVRHARSSKNSGCKPNKRIFNNAKISDHFAIIPTLQLAPKHLNEAEAKLYDLVVRRFLAVFYPAAEYLADRRASPRRARPFKSEGKILQAGRLARSARQGSAGRGRRQPCRRSRRGETARTVVEIDVMANQTKPPARFTEATLLSAMEGAGKLVEDEELRDAMEAKGLGTPATRAAIIEGLIAEEYVLRNGRELRPTPKAFSLLTLLKGFGIPELTSPELTGEWEYKLKQMEHGKLSRAEFMRRHRGHDDARSCVRSASRAATVPGDTFDARHAVPEMRRRRQGELHEVPVPELRFRAVANTVGPPVRARGDRGADLNARHRSASGLPQPHRQTVRREHQAHATSSERNSTSGSSRATATSEPIDFSSARRPLGACPKCGARVFAARRCLHLRERGGGPAKLRLPLRQDHSAAADRTRADAEAAERAARPTCCIASSRRRGGRSRRYLVTRSGRKGRLRVRAARSGEGAGARTRRRAAQKNCQSELHGQTLAAIRAQDARARAAKAPPECSFARDHRLRPPLTNKGRF